MSNISPTNDYVRNWITTFNLTFFLATFSKNDKTQHTRLPKKDDWDCERVSICKDHQIFPSFALGKKYFLPEQFLQRISEGRIFNQDPSPSLYEKVIFLKCFTLPLHHHSDKSDSTPTTPVNDAVS